MKNPDQEFSGDLTRSIVNQNIYTESSSKIVKVNTRISAQELHKYVMGLIGIFIVFFITYPMAIGRVSQQGKFASDRSHVKSLSLEYQPIE
jgi:hypothetical protein